MPRLNGIAGLLLLCVMILARPVGAQPNGTRAEAEQKAQAAATEWLALVDDGDFGDSWEAAASSFREGLEEEQWDERGERLRDSLQARTRRIRTMVQYRDSLRSTPGGPFVVLMYRSTFERGRAEEVLLTSREEGAWKVAGYKVTPLPRPDARASSVSDRAASP